MAKFDVVSIVIAAVFFIPLIYGAFNPVTKYRLQYFAGSLFDSLEFLGALFLSVYFTGRIFFQNGSGEDTIYRNIYEVIPEEIKNILQGQGILTYVAAVPVILILLLLVFRIITTPLYKLLVEPVAEIIYETVDRFGVLGRSVLGALWRLPKALCLMLALGIGVNIYTHYEYNPELTRMLNQSAVYQFVHNKAVSPVLNSNLAKKIPVIVNDSFGRTANDALDDSIPEKLINQLSGRNIKVIRYFNGVTLEDAIKSTPEIDQAALKIVEKEKTNTKKAYLLYKWISQNVEYDYEKAEKLASNPEGISSGSIIAFNTGKGVCFDYSSLYISMCRAVGLKVRLITGLGYSGLAWGDHAWNQVYSSEEDRWINVDATFGSSANYFDKKDFNLDHKYDEIQGEW